MRNAALWRTDKTEIDWAASLWASLETTVFRHKITDFLIRLAPLLRSTHYAGSDYGFWRTAICLVDNWMEASARVNSSFSKFSFGKVWYWVVLVRLYLRFLAKFNFHHSTVKLLNSQTKDDRQHFNLGDVYVLYTLISSDFCHLNSKIQTLYICAHHRVREHSIRCSKSSMDYTLQRNVLQPYQFQKSLLEGTKTKS